MPTVLIRNAVATKVVAFQRVPSVRPSGLIRKKPIVNPCRCLFGTPDHQEAIRIARDEIKEEQKRLASKYNFDFESCAPLPGKYLYEKVDTSLDEIAARLITDDSGKDQKQTGVTQRKNITDFYTVSRKRPSTFENPKEKILATSSRLRVSEVRE